MFGHGVFASWSISSVEPNQNVESKTETYWVQNSIFTSRNQLFWDLTHLMLVAIT